MKTKSQNKAYAVYTTWKDSKVFADYQDAWKYAQKVYANTGTVIAIETVN